MKNNLIRLTTKTIVFATFLTICVPLILTGQKQSKETEKAITEKEIPGFIEKSLLDGQKTFGSSIEDGVKTIQLGENIGDPTIMVTVDSKKYLKGDLTSDGKIDIVVTASMTVGVSTMIDLYFVFKNTNDKYVYLTDFSTRDVNTCKTKSDFNYFKAEKISTNYLIGKSSCWTDMDPHCCPSSVIATKLKWDIASKTFKPTN